MRPSARAHNDQVHFVIAGVLGNRRARIIGLGHHSFPIDKSQIRRIEVLEKRPFEHYLHIAFHQPGIGARRLGVLYRKSRHEPTPTVRAVLDVLHEVIETP